MSPYMWSSICGQELVQLPAVSTAYNDVVPNYNYIYSSAKIKRTF